MLFKASIQDQKNYFLITLSLFVVPLVLKGGGILMLSPGYFLLLSIENYWPAHKWTIGEHLQHIVFLIWGLISCYLPIQMTQILTAKINFHAYPWKLILVRGSYYFLFSTIIQIGLFFPWLALTGIGRYLTFERIEDHGILLMRILVGIFIAWACYQNISNLKKLFTREFWNLKIITIACLRFIALSTLSGIITCGTFYAIYYISKQF